MREHNNISGTATHLKNEELLSIRGLTCIIKSTYAKKTISSTPSKFISQL